jgi:hypothetical protein
MSSGKHGVLNGDYLSELWGWEQRGIIGLPVVRDFSRRARLCFLCSSTERRTGNECRIERKPQT